MAILEHGPRRKHHEDALDQLDPIAQIVGVDVHRVPAERREGFPLGHVLAPLRRVAVIVALILENHLPRGQSEIGAETLAPNRNSQICHKAGDAGQGEEYSKPRLLRGFRVVVEQGERRAEQASATPPWIPHHGTPQL